jgi:uncharacterized protein (TIGR00369 family)
MEPSMNYALSSPEQIRELSGLEFLRAMVAREVPAPPIAGTMGFRLAEVDPGRAVFECEPGPGLLNPLGSVHGGLALTLIDSATGCALHTELEAGIGYTTVETKVNFVRPMMPGMGWSAAKGGC